MKEKDDIAAEGYSASVLLVQMSNGMLHDGDLTDQTKAAIAIKMAEADLRLQDGASEHLQVRDVRARDETSYTSKAAVIISHL